MIVFDLSCEQEHHFEGWFHSAPDFSDQLRTGMLQCPQCGSLQIVKRPSAVAINSSPGVTEAPQKTHPVSAPNSSTHLKGLYRQLAQAIASISEDVGDDFADEARRMHYRQARERSIRGRSTEDEFDALRDEGIAVMRLPAFKEEDLN